MDTKDKNLHRSVAALSIRVLNVENIVGNIKNKPDRKIISIYAGIDGPIHGNKKFNFGVGGGYYVMNFPGQILGISLVSLRTSTDIIAIKMIVNDKSTSYKMSLDNGVTHGFNNFYTPFEVKAGDLISFISMTNNYTCINTLVSVKKIREPRGVKGIRQSVSITNNPSTIDQNQQLLVRFPNLSNNDVIVPGTTRLAFEIELTSTDDNATIYQNIGRTIVKKTTIRISGNEIMSIDDSDIYHCYVDLWKSTSERLNMAYQGIGETNMLKHRVGADDKASDTGDEAIATAYGARFCIPLDFELLETHMPFYQAGLGDRLEYELTFNNYSNVIKSTDTSASYTIKNICLEFDMVTDAELARQIRQQVNGKMVILYDRILRHRKITKNKSDTLWNINLNVPARSMKGILMLFEDPERTSTETYYNPNITKVEMTIEGVPNQLYSQGMKAYQQWDEINKFFALNSKRNKTTEEVLKDLNLSYTTLEKYLTTNYALWLDLRSTDDNSLHGSGRRIENASEGITIQITKTAGANKLINVYLFVIQDAQINFEDGRFKEVNY
ncbi:unnamed protein product [Mytilus edulis]|uniref:Uncharacterized protein n=1 Tax=Mytilus edulis TaxID=6550 RepID=A0A8S3RKZ0_MYTED|nr:unnamed protein product [Mytilus edulis]